MDKRRKLVEHLLSFAGVRLDGPNPWDVRVNDERMFARVIRYKSLGLGESYMDGWWDCDRLDDFIHRILAAGIDRKLIGSLGLLLPAIPSLIFNRQDIQGSKEVAEHHYDLDNEFFMNFLDPYNQYSCAYFNDTPDLASAQLAKLDLICKKLDLTRTDSVLDIGSGWGGFARYAAERYGCSVTGVNISHEQVDYATRFCKGLPITILRQDYRRVGGLFDKIVSVGMFEHVGRKNYRSFMEVAHQRLKDGGSFLLHTIGRNEAGYGCDPWISKYIFPNGMLPGLSQISKSIERLFVMEDLHNLGPHYDKTLMAWNDNFQEAWPKFSHKFDNRFKRMWEYYLLSCAGAFRARDIQIWQMVLTKYGTPQPYCRYA